MRTIRVRWMLRNRFTNYPHTPCLYMRGISEVYTDLQNVEFKYYSKSKHHKYLYYDAMRPFKCQHCELSFDRASQLDYHRRSLHLGEKSQICQICGKGFFRKSDLRTHLNIHLGTNLCICETCGRKFSHVSNLIRHCRMHNGVKPYPCSICGKRFTQISSLVRHKHIHERSKKRINRYIKCVDDKARVQGLVSNDSEFVKDNIPDHRKNFKRKHYCKVCGESFNFILLLKQHEKSHVESTELLECKSCKQNFNRVEDLKEHRCFIENVNIMKDKNSKENVEIQELTVGDNMLNGEASCMPKDKMTKRLLPLETIVYVTSEQFRKMNLEQIEDTTYNLLQEHFIDLNEVRTPYNDEQRIGSFDTNAISVNKPDKVDTLNRINRQTFSDNVDPENTHSYVEPMLRLVQTETGQQFYELIINHSVEKINFNQPQQTKSIEKKFDEDLYTKSSITKNLREASVRYDEMLRDQESQNFSNANKQLAYPESYSESSVNVVDKDAQTDIRTNIHTDIHTVNLSLLDDTQTDFEKYVETNLEVLERFTYDNSTERFFEFVEIGENGQEVATYKESPMVCLVQNEGEPFFGLLQDPHVKDNYDHDHSYDHDHNQNLVQNNEFDKDGLINEGENNESNEDIPQESKKFKVPLKKFQCTVCKKAFSTGYNYKQHIGTHFTDQQKFHCKECGMSFAWKSTLNKHITSNHSPNGPQKYVCEICPKVYSTLSQVNEHVKRDHLKQRNHTCPHCGKSFFKKFDLKTHSRTHTNERPYVCRACGKRFHHQSHIIRHERIHSGERPYECNICQKSFTQPSSLKVHKQKHQEIRMDILDYQMDEDDPVAVAAL